MMLLLGEGWNAQSLISSARGRTLTTTEHPDPCVRGGVYIQHGVSRAPWEARHVE